MTHAQGAIQGTTTQREALLQSLALAGEPSTQYRTVSGASTAELVLFE